MLGLVERAAQFVREFSRPLLVVLALALVFLVVRAFLGLGSFDEFLLLALWAFSMAFFEIYCGNLTSRIKSRRFYDGHPIRLHRRILSALPSYVYAVMFLIWFIMLVTATIKFLFWGNAT